MADRRPCRAVGIAATSIYLAMPASPAAAHGFGQRFDLPLPLWLWVIGAGASIILSFVVMAVFVREQPIASGRWAYDLKRLAPVRLISRSPVIEIIRAAAAVVFVLMIVAGLYGAQDPYSNIITTIVWVIWWVGLAFVCALVGNVWNLINPLRTLFGWAEQAYAAFTGGGVLSRKWHYPGWLGFWPAVVLFLAFAWAELVWDARDEPKALAFAVLGYSVVTWIGMFVWGREAWLNRGEAFSIAFGVLARFAPIGAQPHADNSDHHSLNLRPYGAGLVADAPVLVSYMVFVLAMLSTVTFDGFLETPAFRRIVNEIYSWPALAFWLFHVSELGISERQVIMTAMLGLFPMVFVVAFLTTSWAMVRIAGSKSRIGVTARSFVLTLVPIAVAYHLSHYFSYLITTGQFIIPLASDPFGFGWDLFGTADYRVNIGLLSPYLFWYSAVIIIIIGHVVAVYLAHYIALRVFGSHRAALLSQVPMVALMVLYTMLSLWTLAQPIVG